MFVSSFFSSCSGGSALELLLGPDGEYIREIIVDELAKGIDAGWRSSLDSFIGSTRSRLLRAFRVSHAAGDSQQSLYLFSGGHPL